VPPRSTGRSCSLGAGCCSVDSWRECLDFVAGYGINWGTINAGSSPAANGSADGANFVQYVSMPDKLLLLAGPALCLDAEQPVEVFFSNSGHRERSRPLSSRRAPRQERASSTRKASYHEGGKQLGLCRGTEKHRQHLPLVPGAWNCLLGDLGLSAGHWRVTAWPPAVRPIRRGAWWLRPMDACCRAASAMRAGALLIVDRDSDRPGRTGKLFPCLRARGQTRHPLPLRIALRRSHPRKARPSRRKRCGIQFLLIASLHRLAGVAGLATLDVL